ncbi:MAG: LysR family transcriptional regulator, partial [Xanthomonadaceae bacterium]|nr:LysR family transcriptional regulator [Xanthomonadaceae bacterium]
MMVLIHISNVNAAMELKHLRLVSAIARHGGLTAAMDELHLSQPALSQRLTSLEKEL